MVLSAAFSIYILRSGAFSNLLILYHICAENAIVNFQFQYLKQQSVEILNQFSIQIAYHIFVKKINSQSDEKCVKYCTLFSIVKLTVFVSNLTLNYNLNNAVFN